jgi:KUP system potassium uptake protein
VAIKYVVFVMRADNEGEGGTMALLSLAVPVAGPLRTGLLIVGLAGASLFFGDAMITPAISVLSAVEGLGIASPAVTPYVVPIAAVVLVCLACSKAVRSDNWSHIPWRSFRDMAPSVGSPS